MVFVRAADPGGAVTREIPRRRRGGHDAAGREHPQPGARVRRGSVLPRPRARARGVRLCGRDRAAGVAVSRSGTRRRWRSPVHRRPVSAGRTAGSGRAPTGTGWWRCGRSTATRRREDGGGARGPRRCIVALGARPENAGESILAEGHDFYGAPRLDATAQRLATAVWDHPDMPWDRSAMVVTPLEVSLDRSTGTIALGRRGPAMERRARVRTSRWGSRPGSATAACASFRIATGGGSPTCTPALPDGEARGGPDRRWRPSSTGPTGPWGSRRWLSWPMARVVARMTSEGRDALVAHRRRQARRSAPLPQPCVAISGLCAHAERHRLHRGIHPTNRSACGRSRRCWRPSRAQPVRRRPRPPSPLDRTGRRRG